MRPAEWTKSFGNMLLAAVSVFYIFGIPIFFSNFLIGFISVALLWSGLYTLNDFTDYKADLLHPVKKERPIPSGKIKPIIALIFSLFLIALSFCIGFLINFYFLFALSAMFLNQLLYTLEPFNFKKRKILDLISGSMINPYFRFYAGWFIFLPKFNAPLFLILFVVLTQFGGYTLYRLTSKEHEISLNYKSSVVVFSEKKLKFLALSAISFGSISFVLLTLNSILNLMPEFLGVLPLKFFSLVILSAFFLPFYLPAFFNPTKADIKKLYKILYFHYFLFILGFLLLLFI